MGSWGVKAHESDRGLDYLGLIRDEILKPSDYSQFDVTVVLEHLKNHIIKGIRHDCRPFTKEEIKHYKANNLPIPNDSGVLTEEQIQEYVDYNFPICYSYVIALVAECLNDYFQTGVYLIHDYKADTERKITKFVYTSDNLEFLAIELEKFLKPTHSEYESWKESKSFRKWKSHIKKLCECMVMAWNIVESLSHQEGCGGNG